MHKADHIELDVHHTRLGTVVGIPGGPVVMKIPNGPLFIIEEMPWLQSATIGFFVAQGSGFEPFKYSGITHFIEHMVFKGTKTRSPRDIALAYEGVGGMLNASTGKEFMNVFGRIGARYVQRGFNVIADMFLNPRFSQADLEKERGVILEEIRMNNDQPSQFLYENFSKQLWGRSPLARQIAGTEKSLSGLNSKVVSDWFKDRFHPDNLVISIAGKVDAESVPRWWTEISKTKTSLVQFKRISAKQSIRPITPEWKSGVKVYYRDVEQATVILGLPAPNVRNPERYAYSLLESILGGGMGSRLFQQIREKSGLAYDIDTGFSPMRGTGVFTIDSATAPAMLFALVEQVLVELRKLKDTKAKNAEFKRVKDYLEGSTYLGMEASSSRMYRNALGMLYLGRLIPTETVMQRLAEVSLSDVQNCAKKYFTKKNLTCGILLPNGMKDNNSVQHEIEKLIKKIL
ncbi:insulinase family protein [bacterium]|nr:insulinase family protein [bacterium]MBU1024367.1 insulinase family protein [bacterium]